MAFRRWRGARRAWYPSADGLGVEAGPARPGAACVALARLLVAGLR
jgi:hypothetical protein